MSASYLQERSVESSAVKRRIYVWYVECVIQWDCYSSYVKIRCQEKANGDCNRLRMLFFVCQWSVNRSHESWVCKWLTNRVTNPNPVRSHSHTWQYNSNFIIRETEIPANSSEHGLSRETNSCSASQHILSDLLNLMVHYGLKHMQVQGMVVSYGFTLFNEFIILYAIQNKIFF
jgi:hypothetical protein